MAPHWHSIPVGPATEIHELIDLSQDLGAQIEYFFVSYNEINGKQFEVKGQAGRKHALALVTAAMKKRKRR